MILVISYILVFILGIGFGSLKDIDNEDINE